MNKMIKLAWVPIVALILVLIFFNNIVSLSSHWLFMTEVNYESIFLTELKYKAITGLVFFAVTFLVLILNILLAAHISPKILIRIPEPLSKFAGKFPFKIVRKVVFVIAFLFSIFIGLTLSNFWTVFLEYINSTPVDQYDPLFNLDVSYFFFSIPALSLILAYLRMLLLVTVIPVIIMYIFTRSATLIFDKGWKTFLKSIDPQVKLHLGLILILHFILSAIGTYISIHQLVYKSNLIHGATYADDKFLIPLMYLNIAVIAVCIVSTLWFMFLSRLSPIIVSIGALFIVEIFQPVLPSLVQQLIVAPNELEKETPYIEKNIKATRDAYNLNIIEEKKLSEKVSLTKKDLNNNQVTLNNVRLWDRDPLLSTFSQIQEIRTYYEFNAIDNDRYLIDGEPRQMMLSARELFSASLPTKNWINERLTFTHGYGVAASPVNQVTEQGLPVLFVKDIPPESTSDTLEIKQPEIYYGEITNQYVITNTKAKEFNYPKGDQNMYESYQGKGGVELNTFWKRILYAVKFGSKEILLSDNIDKNSRIMYKRRIMERIQTVAPFFNYDNDPYMVIANGKLYWMVDAYTSNSLYPYAEPINFQGRRINYIRNSVKIIVNAYNGDITFYKTTDKDPIINVIDKIYPDLLTDMDKMPEALRAHIRYPQGIFDLQTEIFRTYHMQNVQNFYNKEDQWEIPVISDVNTKEQGSSIAPRHLVMKLPDEKKAEYILMLPYTPRGKNNLAAWLAARNDGKNYGEMVVYRFPKDSLVYGPAQITSRINQDADISQQISLWDQRGSQAIQGPLLVIPIEQSLLYVRPLYLQAESGKIPELKRVIVAYKDKIKMAETFETALGKIFGDITEAENKNDAKQQSKPSQSDQSITKTTEDTKQEDLSADEQEIIEKAKKYYEAAIEAQRNGNWKEYGENIKKLGDLLE